ncbi:MAG TPA: SAM-dependent methyltransferase [Jiangellaceae bacterium]
MVEPLLPALERVRADLLDDDRLIRAVAAGRRRGDRPAFRRAELRWVDIRAGRRLQVVKYDDRQAFTINVRPDQAAAAVQELVEQPYGNWHVETTDGTTQLRVTKSGEAQVHRSARPADVEAVHSHDRTKARLLDPTDPFLQAVGISDDRGLIKPSRMAKYRQVEEFLRALEPVLPDARDAAGDGVLRVVDLGCGNAYLSFAAYRWLTDRHGLDVRLVGVDVKAQARRRNTELAARLGWSDSVRFMEGTIEDADTGPPPHLVFALHACDTATDDALARAVRWQAPVVLAAPCCHHDIQRQLVHVATPQPYGPMNRHGILRERFADVLTDAVRAELLRLLGYRVEVIDFVDSVHTPRNTLLRAVRTGASPDPIRAAEYVELISQWGLRPALQVRLGNEVELALAVKPS